MEQLTNNHLFGILLCVAFFYGFSFLRQKLKSNWINPLLLTTAGIIILLLITGIPYENFMTGGSVIHAFLGPVTVVLALPLYRQRELLMKHIYSIMCGIVVGVVSAIGSVVVLCRLMGLNEILERSLIGHSVTTPIGIGLSSTLKGIEGITVISIIITGIAGAAMAPMIYKLFRIVHPVAKGIGLGTASHALGTTKAIEMGETEGAMSGLAIGVTAITTIFAVVIMQWMGWY